MGVGRVTASAKGMVAVPAVVMGVVTVEDRAAVMVGVTAAPSSRPEEN